MSVTLVLLKIQKIMFISREREKKHTEPCQKWETSAKM